MLKLNRLFFTSGEAEVFSDHIEPQEAKKRYLIDCKNKIRDYLRPQIRQATVAILGMEKAITPRFRTQGSWSYGTCVDPAYQPPQEMDWDFGVYLPVTVWEENGPPEKMAKAYFDLVEKLLKTLCEQENWTLASGKKTCIRIKVATWAHIDIPLYAAPEDEFHLIMEKVALAKSMAFDSRSLEESAEFSEALEVAQEWADLDQIMMATRTGEWKPSDPEAVTRWFKDRLDEYGDQLQRVCRYLKAWRDYHWKDGGGPTSVSIMIAISQDFKVHKGRDDLALEMAAQRLSAALLSGIFERAIDDGVEDFNRLEPSERQDASQRANVLTSTLKQARFHQTHLKDRAIGDVRSQFGDRVPNRVDLIDADNDADVIRSTPPTRVVPPVVPATKAG